MHSTRACVRTHINTNTYTRTHTHANTHTCTHTHARARARTAPLQMLYTQAEYEAAKAQDPDFYRGPDSLEYGKSAAVPEANIDKMVAAMAEQ